MSSKLFVVVGGAYGSEGKGSVTGRICADLERQGKTVFNVRVGGPNAGHTVIGKCPPDCPDLLAGQRGETVEHDVSGHPWRLRQVPVAAVTAPTAHLVIAAGSEIDHDVLKSELAALDSAGYDAHSRLYIDRSATMLEARHREDESLSDLNKRLGSTAKGIGAARADRIWRTARTWGDVASADYAFDTTELLREALADDDHAVVVEGTQGYGLGLHTSNYPFTTSGDCRAIDFLAQAGISPWQLRCCEHDLKIVVCMRPHPIRVAGNSGGLLGETSWSELGLPVEYTTVTQKVRRVGEWDHRLAIDAIRANGGPQEGVVWVALTMMDSVEPELAGCDGLVTGVGWDPGLRGSLSHYLDSVGVSDRSLGYVGTGPATALVNERMYS